MRRKFSALALALAVAVLAQAACETRIGTGFGDYPAGARRYRYAEEYAGGQMTKCELDTVSGTEADRASFDLRPCGRKFVGGVEGARAFEGQRTAADIEARRAADRRVYLTEGLRLGAAGVCAGLAAAGVPVPLGICVPPAAGPTPPAIETQEPSIDD